MKSDDQPQTELDRLYARISKLESMNAELVERGFGRDDSIDEEIALLWFEVREYWDEDSDVID